MVAVEDGDGVTLIELDLEWIHIIPLTAPSCILVVVVVIVVIVIDILVVFPIFVIVIVIVVVVSSGGGIGANDWFQ